ncbi:MAG: DUF2007 domain-containing protein [Chloroflexi bacterium]|nr:DUF2007 domain-containing protein [Chloroflexota bacterium]
MDKLTWEKVAEVQGRLDADLVESYLEANGVDVELVQEALGRSIIPVMIDGLGRVQVFVPKEKVKEARELLKNFTDAAILE